MIKVLLVDPGDVFILADHRRTIEQLVRHGISRELAEGYFKRSDYAEFARGKLTLSSYISRLLGEWNPPETFNDAVTIAHTSHIYGVDLGVLEILERVRIPVCLATATNQIEWERISWLLKDQPAWFPKKRVWRSDERGFLKSDPGAFKDMVDAWLPSIGYPNIAMSEVTFVDDSVDNIQRAIADGLLSEHCHLYQTDEVWALSDWLSNLNLIN